MAQSLSLCCTAFSVSCFCSAWGSSLTSAPKAGLVEFWVSSRSLLPKLKTVILSQTLTCVSWQHCWLTCILSGLFSNIFQHYSPSRAVSWVLKWPLNTSRPEAIGTAHSVPTRGEGALLSRSMWVLWLQSLGNTQWDTVLLSEMWAHK